MNAGKRISHDRNLWISPLLAPNLWITADLHVVNAPYWPPSLALSAVSGAITPETADKSVLAAAGRVSRRRPRRGRGQAPSAAAAAWAAAGRASAMRASAASSWAAETNQAS